METLQIVEGRRWSTIDIQINLFKPKAVDQYFSTSSAFGMCRLQFPEGISTPLALLTLLEGLLAVTLFLPDTRLLRILRKDWRRDFFRDLTRERGPSIARESLGCRVHLSKRNNQSPTITTSRPSGVSKL